MRFNSQEGAIVADEQSTYGNRKLSFADKLVRIGNGETYAIIGGTGHADFLFNVSERLRDYFNINPAQNSEQIAEITARIMDVRKLAIVRGELESNLGIRYEEFISGHCRSEEGQVIPIRQDLIERMNNIQNQANAQISNNTFTILGKDKDNVRLYRADASNLVPTLIGRPYDVVGSGNDSADEVIVEFIEKLEREKLKNIDPVEGIEALIYATHRASVRNQGVGGTPVIYVIGKEGAFLVSEARSQLADNMVRGYRREFLDRDVLKMLLQETIYGEKEVDDIEDQMFEAAKKGREFVRYLTSKKS